VDRAADLTSRLDLAVHLHEPTTRQAPHHNDIPTARAFNAVPLSHDVVRGDGAHREAVEEAVGLIVRRALGRGGAVGAQRAVDTDAGVVAAAAEPLSPVRVRALPRDLASLGDLRPRLGDRARREDTREADVLQAVSSDAVPFSNDVAHGSGAQAEAVEDAAAVVELRAGIGCDVARKAHRANTLPTVGAVVEETVGPAVVHLRHRE